jgi:uncharacterized protein (DUF2384 family)
MKSSMRIAEIEAYAEKIFGSADKARSWMQQNNFALGGTPVSKLGTNNGVNDVRKILEAIARGGVV